MMASHIRKFMILIFTIVFILMIAYGYFSGFFFFSGLTPCLPPPNVAVDGMAYANILTWNDLNGNGLQEEIELPLPNIEIAYVAGSDGSDRQTDQNGLASMMIFRPGCPCRCWEGESITVLAPVGYIGTTPLIVDLKGDNLTYKFGFHKE